MYVFYVGFLNFDIFHIVAIASYRTEQKLSHFKNLNRHSNKSFPHRDTCPKNLYRQWTINISIGETWLNAHFKVESQLAIHHSIDIKIEEL